MSQFWNGHKWVELPDHNEDHRRMIREEQEAIMTPRTKTEEEVEVELVPSMCDVKLVTDKPQRVISDDVRAVLRRDKD